MGIADLTDASDDSYPAESMAVDGHTVYCYVPGTGIVTPEFVPAEAC
ncbi:MAG: hypothetical protein QOJ46_1955 [bacterium]